MGTEVCSASSAVLAAAAPSTFDRPFKILVQDETFLVDSESMRKMSPVFSVMFYGADFNNGRELSREIVDEKKNDIQIFFRAVDDSSVINASNFPVILRLSNKYQVQPVIDACHEFIRSQHLDVLKPDEVLTLLISAFDFHCTRDVMVKLIRRLAQEGNATFTKLKISRFLPVKVYGAVISTSLNLVQLGEHEKMHGHVLKMERSRIRWKNSMCAECSRDCDECAFCSECQQMLCRTDIQEKKCSTDLGKKVVSELDENAAEFSWD